MAAPADMQLCQICADRIRRWYGAGIVPTEMVIDDGDARDDAAVCAACLGVLQFADTVLAGAGAAGVRASPFLDCPRISLVVSVPRALSFTMASVCWRLLAAAGRVVDGSAPTANTDEAAMGNDGDAAPSVGRQDPVPRSLIHFARDAAISRITTRLSSSLALATTNAAGVDANDIAIGSKRSREGADGTRFGDVQRWARSDDPDTIVVDLIADIACHTPSGNGGDEDAPPPVTAFVARRSHDTDGLDAARVSGSALAAALCKLPEEQQGNKADAAFTWGLVESAVVAAHTEDRRAGRVLRVAPVSHVWRTSLFVFGRYRKMMRDVPQSPWFINKERVGRLSLQEVIAEQVLPVFYDDATISSGGDGSVCLHGTFLGGKKNPPPKAAVVDQILGANLYKFMSAGREDVDVRMLGNGRPFVIELKSPHRVSTLRAAELDAIEAAVLTASDDVEVEGLAVTTCGDITKTLHDMSREKRKHYRCVCYCSRPLKSDADAGLERLRAVRDLEVQQQTPLRVLHRRAQMNRPKVVHSASVRRAGERWVVVDLETQAGAYIKEFCHGDLGRTRPALGDLLDATTDIVQLDVVGVAVDPDVRATVERMLTLRSSTSLWGDDDDAA